MYTIANTLDTNVLIENPKAIYDFPNELVVIPFMTIEELDNLKTSSDIDVRRKSRIASNILDALTEQCDDDIIPLENGSGLLIEMNHQGNIEVNPDKPDNRIISVAIGLAKEGKFEEVRMISMDTNVRLLARNYGKQLEIPLKASKYTSKETIDDIALGLVEEFASPEFMAELRKNGEMRLLDREYANNEHIIFIDETNLKNQMFGIYDSTLKTVKVAKDYKKGKGVFNGVKALNTEQIFAMNDLMDTTKELNFITSKTAGCGKNYIITACALELLGGRAGITYGKGGHYDRLIILKPMISVGGADLGFLPGEKEDKIKPWFSNQQDIMETLLDGRVEIYERMLEERIIELDVVTFMRGRSIPNSIIFVDEAQNFKPEELKTLLTRVGKNVKMVIAGDLSQIDHPRLDPLNCGLNVWMERARNPETGYENSTHICLRTTVRSDLAEWASKF